MIPRVVNLKKDKYSIYIGRPGKSQNGKYGNPFPIDKEVSRVEAERLWNIYFDSWCPKQIKESIVKSIMLPRKRGESIKLHKNYLNARCAKDLMFQNEIKQWPPDTKLGCFCSPLACHGDNYVELWMKLNESN